ncbi:MAG: DUF4846 domain-containing protein [Bacteroidota bacterium]
MYKNFVVFLTALFIVLFGCKYENSKGQSINETADSEKTSDEIIKPQEEANYKIVAEIPVPKDYSRVAVDSNSFSWYLRNLELKTGDNVVYLYNGDKKWNQNAHFAIINIDVGTQDLQQCADAVMRLRGEYLYLQKKYDQIHFSFLSDGKPRYYNDYVGNDHGFKKFRSYMNYIFSYANTASLDKELKPITIDQIQAGDVFIMTGNPYGHAVTVMDIAKNKKTGKKIFLLSQSYMPAQDIHILKNPENENLSPWYKADFEGSLVTPEWVFEKKHLKRFTD